MLESYGWECAGGHVVMCRRPCDFSVSPRSKSFFFSFLGGLLFNLGACWDKGLDLDQGLTIKMSMSSDFMFKLLQYNVLWF